jgi:uncharacterized OB-fold protein
MIGRYDAPFWEHTKNHELRLQRCTPCGKFRWPPAAVCDACLSSDYTWGPVSGKATLLSWVVFQRQYFPGLPTPYNSILVELDEGPLFISNLVGVENDAIEFDIRVEVDFQDLPEGFTLPVFRRVG